MIHRNLAPKFLFCFFRIYDIFEEFKVINFVIMSSNTKMSPSVDKQDNINGNSIFRQMMHNDNERKRKKRMIEMIDTIVELLPMKCTGKTSRIARLEQLHSYIIDLKNKNDGLMFANPSSVHGLYFFC